MVESRFIRYGQGFQTPSPHGLHGSETKVESLGWEDPLEKEIATHSSILVWEIPWREEPSMLQPMESQRVRHNLATKQQHNNKIQYYKQEVHNL